jgi:hypothetical protein
MVRYFEARQNAAKSPTVIFVPGFMSHGQGLKAKYLSGHCSAKGYNYLCYDPEGVTLIFHQNTSSLVQER